MEMLDLLRRSWDTCDRCRLHLTRTHVVFGSGSPTAKLMLVGEGPGAHEDESGVPFVGESGALLDKVFKTVGIVRRQLFICNSVGCRPPGNRDPRPDEQEACWSRLVNIMDVVQPSCLLLLGAPASRQVLGREVHITTDRGQQGKVVVGGREMDYVLCLHPAYVLRNKQDEKLKASFVGDVRLAWDVANGWDQIPF